MMAIYLIPHSTLGSEIDYEKLDREKAINFALTGGDDYELLFTIPEKQDENFLKRVSGKATCIGFITQHKQQIIDETGMQLTSTGYNHFHVR